MEDRNTDENDPLSMVETSISPVDNQENDHDVDTGQFLKVRSSNYLQSNTEEEIRDSEPEPLAMVKSELEEEIEPSIKSEPIDEDTDELEPTVPDEYPDVYSAGGLTSAYRTSKRVPKGNSKEKNFPCTMCLNTFKRRSNLVRHIRTHTKEKPFDCTDCDKSFNFKESLKRHLRDHHSKNLCKVCPHCSKEFEEVSDYKAHMEQHKIDGFKCDICSKRFSVKSTMRRHRKTHDEYYAGRSIDTFSEDGQDDGELENDPLALVKPELKDKPEYAAGISGQSNEINPASATSDTPVFYPMAVLEKINAGEQVFTCVVCLKTFNRKKNLRRHIRVHTQERPYQCKECDKSFNHRDNLKKHMKEVHQKELGRQCTHCPEEFFDLDEYRAHIEKHKTDGFPCEVCGKRFGEKSTMVKHRKIHFGIKPFPCDDCGKRFRDNNRLNEHRRVHFKDEAFTCKECDKSFVSYRNLLRHQLLHTGEKPFACEECDKTFTQKKNLENHMKIHRGEKPFVCEYCGKAFRIKGEIVRHRRIHTGEKPYSCSLCGDTFRENKQLKKHMKNKHEDTDTDTLIDTSVLELHLKSHIDKLVHASGEMMSDEADDKSLDDGQGSSIEVESREEKEKEGTFNQESEEMANSSVMDELIDESSESHDRIVNMRQEREQQLDEHMVDKMMDHGNENTRSLGETEIANDNLKDGGEESFVRQENVMDINQKIAERLWSPMGDRMKNCIQESVAAPDNVMFDRARDDQIGVDIPRDVRNDRMLRESHENTGRRETIIANKMMTVSEDVGTQRNVINENVGAQRNVMNAYIEPQGSVVDNSALRNLQDRVEKHSMTDRMICSQGHTGTLWNPMADRMRGNNQERLGTFSFSHDRIGNESQMNVGDRMANSSHESMERRDALMAHKYMNRESVETQSAMNDTMMRNYQGHIERQNVMLDRMMNNSQGHVGALWNPMGYKMTNSNQESVEALSSVIVNRMMYDNQSLDIQRNAMDYRMMNNSQESVGTIKSIYPDRMMGSSQQSEGPYMNHTQ